MYAHWAFQFDFFSGAEIGDSIIYVFDKTPAAIVHTITIDCVDHFKCKCVHSSIVLDVYSINQLVDFADFARCEIHISFDAKTKGASSNALKFIQ